MSRSVVVHTKLCRIIIVYNISLKMPVLVDLFSISRCMAFREFSDAISYCVIYKYTYTNINILNNTMSFTFIYVENLITWMVSNKVLVIKWINYTSHIQHLHYRE